MKIQGYSLVLILTLCLGCDGNSLSSSNQPSLFLDIHSVTKEFPCSTENSSQNDPACQENDDDDIAIPPDTHAVPEPLSLVLLSSGFVGVALLRKKSRG